MEIDNRNKKPTQDPEINAVINGEEPIVEEVKPEDVVPEPEPEKPTEPIVEPTETPEEPKTPVEEPKEEPEVDYKEKFKASTQEALTLHFKNEKLKNTIEEAANIPEPTEEELDTYIKSTGADPEEIDDFTRGILKKTLLSEKRFEKINEVNKEAKDLDILAGKVDHYIESAETINTYPDIVDNAEDFRKFCMQKEHRGTPIEDLARSFLYGLSMTPVKKNKGSILLPAGGGGAEPKPEGITEEQAKMIRETNPKEYTRLIKAGKIKIEL